MTLEEGKKLLTAEGIAWEQREYEGEKAYWEAVLLFPYTANARNCRVTVLRIPSRNGNTHLELQFNEKDGVFVFEDLRFGGYVYELFSTKEEYLEEELLACIRRAMDGKACFVMVNDLKKKRWLGDGCNDREDGEPGIREILEKLAKPRGWLARLFGSKRQYEVYDWNEYHCVVR